MKEIEQQIIGFSTNQDPYELGKKPNYVLVDYDIAKQDLINHFYTKKGERLMMPEFGTIIWDMIFEPLNAINRNLILADVKDVINFDPRFSLTSVDINEYDNGLEISMSLIYKPLNAAKNLSLKFDKNSKLVG